MGAATNLDSAGDTAAAAQISCEKDTQPLTSPPQQQQQKPHENMQDACETSADPREYGAVQSAPASDAVSSSSSKPPDDRENPNTIMNSCADRHRGGEFARISEEDPIVDPARTRSYCPAPIGRRRSNLHGSKLGSNELIAWPSPLLAGRGFCSGAPPSPAPTTAIHSPASSPCSDDSGFSLFTSNKFC
ncbi:hypothetical protein H4R20_005923 [Coemansia guatemalensis]|uniref:Uncharacterized protein n=1 Tax=Coemansia guatemalensis TaxID=2761395 RepID=A0A9W8HWX6_9FUNG|nr:hypothetical protein H4R20_005923 [Coemansia guatemalensis]